MTTSFHSRLIVSLKAFSAAAGVVVILGGCLILLGWIVHDAILKSLIPGRVAMNSGTAILFLLGGAALALQQAERLGPSARRAGQMLAVLLVAAALATLPGAILKWDYSWDRLLFRDQLFR